MLCLFFCQGRQWPYHLQPQEMPFLPVPQQQQILPPLSSQWLYFCWLRGVHWAKTQISPLTSVCVCVCHFCSSVGSLFQGCFFSLAEEIKSHLPYQSIKEHRCSLQLTESSRDLEFSIHPASVRGWPGAPPQFLGGRPSSFSSHSINAVGFHRLPKFYAF